MRFVVNASAAVKWLVEEPDLRFVTALASTEHGESVLTLADYAKAG